MIPLIIIILIIELLRFKVHHNIFGETPRPGGGKISTAPHTIISRGLPKDMMHLKAKKFYYYYYYY
jgi:hypothetical protein